MVQFLYSQLNFCPIFFLKQIEKNSLLFVFAFRINSSPVMITVLPWFYILGYLSYKKSLLTFTLFHLSFSYIPLRFTLDTLSPLCVFKTSLFRYNIFLFNFCKFGFLKSLFLKILHFITLFKTEVELIYNIILVSGI